MTISGFAYAFKQVFLPDNSDDVAQHVYQARWGLVLFLWMVVSNAFAEGGINASVTVLRADNHKPLPDAIVTIAPLDLQSRHIKTVNGFTSANGTYEYSFEQPVIIIISHLGFATITDTLFELGNKTYNIQLSAKNMEDVVVTGQYGNNDIRKSVYEVKVINSEMLRAKGANNLREALESELNIDLGQDQVFGSYLGINGISGEGVKIMVDGAPLVGRLDGKIDLSEIDINNIERIEIVEGPLSVMYGTDAMGGV
ncbi:MAG TPA: Plug domain-containing protein, partial [Chitinophagales bacterium]|nr:Plug domain-containing protein [Chitinophagales bacterium]